jgi:hypothetical protein
MMFSVTYISFAIQPFNARELLDLLTVAREHNGKVAVTGMLLYKEGSFMQVLEGRGPTVNLLLTRIERDPRHREIKLILREPIEERVFPDWSMGFQDLGSAEARSTPGFSEFLNTPLTSESFAGDAGRVRKLLGLFKRRL